MLSEPQSLSAEPKPVKIIVVYQPHHMYESLMPLDIPTYLVIIS